MTAKKKTKELLVDENSIGDKLTLKQERFCRLYTQNEVFFGNATLSYAEAYQYPLDEQRKDDAVWGYKDDEETDEEEDEEDDFDEENEGEDEKPKRKRRSKVIIEKSSYDKMYDICSSLASRLLKNDKIQARNRELFNEMLRDDVVDAKLFKIIVRGRDNDVVQAIKEYNKLKGRIIEKVQANVVVEEKLTEAQKKKLEELYGK